MSIEAFEPSTGTGCILQDRMYCGAKEYYITLPHNTESRFTNSGVTCSCKRKRTCPHNRVVRLMQCVGSLKPYARKLIAEAISIPNLLEKFGCACMILVRQSAQLGQEHCLGPKQVRGRVGIAAQQVSRIHIARSIDSPVERKTH